MRLLRHFYIIAFGILPLPEIADGFRGVVQPFTIRYQRNRFDGTKKHYGGRPQPAQWPQFSRSDQRRDILRRAVQELRDFSRPFTWL